MEDVNKVQQKAKKSKAEILSLNDQEIESFILDSDLCVGDQDKFEQQIDVKDQIGKGGFGSVFKCYDHHDDMFVAMKRMPQDIGSFDGNKWNILHELQIVQRINRNKKQGEDEFVLKCLKYFYVKKVDEITKKSIFQLFFIYPLAECDVYYMIKENREKKRNFQETHAISFIWQIVLALKTLKVDYQIMHRDLKPQNILKVNNKYYLADFTTCKIQMDEALKKAGKSTSVPYTIEYMAAEMISLALGQEDDEQEIEEIKKNAEKGDIFSLAISAFTLLFHDVKAAELSNLKKGPAKVKQQLELIQNPKLKKLLKGMSEVDYKNRYSIQDCILFFQNHLFSFLKPEIIPLSFKIQPNQQQPDSQKQEQSNKSQLYQPFIHSQNPNSLPENQKPIIQASQQQEIQKQPKPELIQQNQQIDWNNIFSNSSSFIKKDERGVVNCLNISECKRYLAVGRSSEFFQIYSFETKKCIQSKEVGSGSLYFISFSPDCKFLIIGDNQNKVFILEQNNQSVFEMVKEIDNEVWAWQIGFLKQREFFVVRNQSLLQFQIILSQKNEFESVKIIKEIKRQQNIYCFQLNQNKNQIAIGYLQGLLELWCLQQDKVIYSYQTNNHNDTLWNIKYSQKEDFVVLAYENESVEIVSLSPQKQVLQILNAKGAQSTFRYLALLQNDQFIVYGSYGGKDLIFYEKDEKGAYKEIMRRQEGYTSKFTVSEDKQTLVLENFKILNI